MNNYYYSQRYGGYASKVIGTLGSHAFTMGADGCLITDCAMLLSYFNDKPLHPDKFLEWLCGHQGLTTDGRLYWNKVNEAAGGKLRNSINNKPLPGETTYGLRQVIFGRFNHWVLDHPLIANKVIDPWDGQVYDYGKYRYTGRTMFYFGKK